MTDEEILAAYHEHGTINATAAVLEIETEKVLHAIRHLPRAVMVPYVMMPYDPETVVIRTPTSNPESYFETILTPDEAEKLAFDLWGAARRGTYMRKTNDRLRSRKAET